jgi:hypothetical protein
VTCAHLLLTKTFVPDLEQTGIGNAKSAYNILRPKFLYEFYQQLMTEAPTMLKTLGIKAYPVAIYSGDPTYVREEWPSPQQFNHAIIAVKVSDATQAETIIQHPSLGRLLIFDPTDQSTPLGDLPDHEQGSLALIVAGEAGALLRMPRTSPDANRLERNTEVKLSPDGSITARVRERSTGSAAVHERRRHQSLSRADYLKMIEGWIARSATGATVSRIEPSDDFSEARFSLEVEFGVPYYAQLMQGRIMVFKPTIVSRLEALPLTERIRKYPIVLGSQVQVETIRAQLPLGFAVDEVPDSVRLEAAFGNYSVNYAVGDNDLNVTRTLILRGATVPAEQYAAVRDFLSASAQQRRPRLCW